MMVHLVHQYMSNAARENPEGLAVSCDESSLTYRELDERTNQIARTCQNRGVKRNDFVPFFIAKSVNAMAALFGISKADCAYIPLDTESPPERIVKILEASNAGHVLVDDASADKFKELLAHTGSTVEVINVDQVDAADTAPLVQENISIDVAYVLFTSGSTGTPKGVMISHQMIIDYIEWCVDVYDIRESDKVANHAPLYFDNSTFDIYTAMKAGAELHLVHDALNKIMPKLIPWIEQRGITVFFCVPSVLSVLQRTKKVDAERLGSLRHVIAAGEVLPPEVTTYWMRQLPEAQITNMYGPTEITVDCTFHMLTSEPGPEGVPIGKARRNMEVFVRQEDGTLSKAPGAEGELAVRGTSVAYGYLNNAEKTTAAFIQNPQHDLYHDPIYLTGDHARIDGDGQIYYVGRLDAQVKHMGNRIELGEIDAALRSIDGVAEATAVFHDGASLEQKYIGALVVLSDSAELTEKELLQAVRGRVPNYMVPKTIRISADLPRTANGKSDRRQALAWLTES